MHVACRKRHVNVVELLLGKFNANINITNKVCVDFVAQLDVFSFNCDLEFHLDPLKSRAGKVL